MRGERLGEEVRRELAEILRGRVRDPELGYAAVTRVEISSDGGHARVYVSFLGDEAEQARGLRALERAGGFVRHELAQRLPVRRVPELAFRLDHGSEHSIFVQRELRELGLGGEHSPDPSPPAAGDAPLDGDALSDGDAQNDGDALSDGDALNDDNPRTGGYPQGGGEAPSDEAGLRGES